MNTVALGAGSLVITVLTIIIGIKRGKNLGILAYAASFVLGLFVLIEKDGVAVPLFDAVSMASLFPFKVFWMTLGVSLMVNVGSSNGTFHIIINKLVSLARGRRSLIPIIIFGVMFASSSVGAGPTGIIVLLCTIAATIAKEQDIDPIFMLLSVISGATIAIGSPYAVLGIICNNFSEEQWNFKIAPSYMYPRAALLSVLTFAVIYIVFKGWKLEKRDVQVSASDMKLNRKQLFTLIGYGIFIVLTVLAGQEMGLVAVFITAVLLVLDCADEKEVISDVPWDSIILICGMCVLIGVTKLAGGVDLLTSLLRGLMNSYTVKPIYSIFGSLLGMVASVSGVTLPAMLPTIPEIAQQTGANPFALVTVLAFGGVAACASPLSPMGAVALSIIGADPKYDTSELFKKMLLATFILTGIAAVWAAIGLAG
ncbi:SLC13 family permease [Diplocloster agilis]|uniref:SLC13 family permease n=1 Tax=Diplocloster agilis TaxID=2850323 RepID=UPI00082073F2|nr:SLC13 family permease [Suonthocola fibrivorans]MCU6735119.1 SLC13 family permease [Suonthocola fibrivorans]SCJ64673.1 Dicarboxylate carrier protein MatC N-terminus [uncultured Clostridium sp.]